MEAMTDPTDKELLEFVARFAGWTEADIEAWNTYQKIADEYARLPRRESFSGLAVGSRLEKAEEKLERGHMPNYLHSVDAWLRDVWPKVKSEANLPRKWMRQMLHISATQNWDSADDVNADARSRCLSLWRALEGRLQ